MIFRKRCQKFFGYKTNTLNIKALQIGVKNDINLQVGKIKIDPRLEKTTSKLKELDLLQYSICKSISNITDSKKKE